MRKSVIYAFSGLVAAAGILVLVLVVCRRGGSRSDEILAAYEEGRQYGGLTILYPLDETVFPPEIVPPAFRWKDSRRDSNEWLVTFKFQDGKERISCCVPRTQWTPSDDEWAAIKRRCLAKKATVTILGVRGDAPGRILSGASISISTSRDEVGVPLFYREVILPFIDAVKEPSRLRWRFGEISCKQQPPIVLENLPVCGNCHSFSADGTTLAMDVDYANSKGSYIIQTIAEEMSLNKSNIITWDDYKKEEKEFTFGLLSQISPDGKYAISTVKDRSVFVPKPDLAFSQLFFPIKGILVVYNRQTRTFSALPGADDKELVQSNPTWSPDGRYIVFARAQVHRLKKMPDVKTVLLNAEESREFLEEGKTFQFDLYRIPFNNGKGGKAVPLEGASHNGMSNYFAKYSPDGKWIVFCKAKSFMLLQPDSELYIIPAAGGKARRLRCNTSRMNSWHSWSPNSRWLVFSSKANTPYTQLFLTHVDAEGRSSPPVVLAQFTAPDRAANIPEFVNTRPGAIRKIHERFVDDFSHLRAGHQLLRERDYRRAIPAYLRALAMNPNNAEAHAALGAILSASGVHDKARAHLLKAVALKPDNSRARRNLGLELEHQGEFRQAMAQYREALRIDPKFVDARLNLSALLMRFNELKEAEGCLSEAVRLRPNDHYAHYQLGLVLRKRGKIPEAVEEYRKSLAIRPDYVPAHFALGQVLVNENQAAEAEKHFTAAIKAKPNAPHQHFFLGLALARQNKLDLAAEAFGKELSIQPDNPHAHCELGKALLARNQAPQAAEHFAAAIKINRNVPDFHLQMGRAQQRTGAIRNAISSYRRAIELKPDLVPALSALAWVYSTHPSHLVRNAKQAVALAQRASELAGGKAPAQLDTLAAAYAEAGRFTEAAETASKAAALAEQTGDTDLAKRVRRRVGLYRAGRPFRQPSP